MSTPVVIKAKNIGKAYRIGLKEERKDTIFAQIASTLSQPFKNFKRLKSLTSGMQEGKEDEDIFWALKGVNFEVKEGEVLGIIGHNGAGKSTLLKILSRITEPTHGEIKIKGRVSSLLEVGTGFHPELSGRDNIYMNGTILGMTKKEIDDKLDEIISFSGIEKHIDTPVKWYSSGMKVRLAFSVAAHLEPEILIIDEVLAVGDAEFQKKCLGKMQDVAGSGRTVLFVSHDMDAVQTLCSRVILLEKGKLIENGKSQDVVKSYLNKYLKIESTVDLSEHPLRVTNKEKLLKRVSIISDPIYTGEDLIFDVQFDNTMFKEMNIGYSVKDLLNHKLFSTSMLQHEKRFQVTHDTIRIIMQNSPLAPGDYAISLYIGNGYHDIDIIENAILFTVNWNPKFDIVAPKKHWGIMHLNTSWEY